MNIRLLNLTQEESDILSYIAADFVKEYINGVCSNHEELFNKIEVDGQQFSTIKSSKDMSSALDCKQTYFVKKHGASALTEGTIKLISHAGFLRDIKEFSKNSNKDEIETQPSQVVIRSGNPEGEIYLFDSPLPVHKCVEFQICKARISRRDSDDTFNIGAGARKLDFRLSPEQYVRFMRSESLMVPCTISSINSDMFDPPLPDYEVRSKIRSNLRSDISKQAKPLYDSEKELIAFIKSNMPFTNKKTLKELNDRFLAFEKIYNEMQGDLKNNKINSAQNISEEFKKNLVKIAQREMERLPDHLKPQLYIPNLK